MNTRRGFLKGSIAAAVVAGVPLAAPASNRGERWLRLGVISDPHVFGGYDVFSREKLKKSCEPLLKALKWFDAQGVDAVVVPGDMADLARVEELQGIADTWNAVFQGGKGTDGRKVEHVLIYGNHESYSNEARGRRAIWAEGRDKVWQEVFGESFDDIRVKTVKGYDFLLASWGWESDSKAGGGKKRFAELAAQCAAKGKIFFEVQHAHPKGTCHGPYAWGHDDGYATEILSKYPNAVAFSGHSHYHLGDERSVWQGDFTSIGCGSFRYTGEPAEDFPPLGPENCTTPWATDMRFPPGTAKSINDGKIMGFRENLQLYKISEGMLVDVYDSGLVIRRREFNTGVDIGADWEVPLPAKKGGPFDPAKRPSAFPLCEFAADASIVVTRGKRKQDRAGIGHDIVEIEVPSGAATSGSELVAYDVGYRDSKNAYQHLQFVVSCDFNMPPGEKSKTMAFPVRADRIPEGAKIAVKPVDCFQRVGKALVASN